MEKRGIPLFLASIIFLIMFSISCSALNIDEMLSRNSSNPLLLNLNPFSGDAPSPLPLYSIIIANTAIIIVDLIIFLALYSFVEKFDSRNSKILGLLVGYLVFVVPLSLFVPIAFVFMTIFYMVGILLPALMKNKYIPVTQRISFGSGGFLGDEVKGFGSGIIHKDHNLYD